MLVKQTTHPRLPLFKPQGLDLDVSPYGHTNVESRMPSGMVEGLNFISYTRYKFIYVLNVYMQGAIHVYFVFAKLYNLKAS